MSLSLVFAGQSVGIKQLSEHIWLVSFMDYDLGYFDHETCRLEPLDNPFGPKVLPMSPEFRNGPGFIGAGEGIRTLDPNLGKYVLLCIKGVQNLLSFTDSA